MPHCGLTLDARESAPPAAPPAPLFIPHARRQRPRPPPKLLRKTAHWYAATHRAPPHRLLAISDAIRALNISKLVADGDIDRLEAEFTRKALTLASFSTPFGNVLHAAAAFGSVATLKTLIERTGLSVNSQSQEGSTPLHVAARAGKFEMVEYLMSREDDIDDTIRDLEGKTCLDVAKSRQITNIIECTARMSRHCRSPRLDSRSIYVYRQTRKMHQAVKLGDLVALKAIFMRSNGSQRNLFLIDVNELDSNGDSILHVAARGDAPELVQACLNFGCDPFLKNRKGKIPIEMARKDVIKKMLREAPMIRSKEIPSGLNEKIEGYLQKWTNYAGGYRRRWFVLESGILAYYEKALDYPVTCRGSLNIEFIKVHPHKSDPCKFDLVGAKDIGLRFSLRADAPEDAKRWIIAIAQAQTTLTADRVRSRSSSSLKLLTLAFSGSDEGQAASDASPPAPQPLLDQIFGELLEQEKQVAILFDLILEQVESGTMPLPVSSVLTAQGAFNQRIRVIRDALLKTENLISNQVYRIDCLEKDRTTLEDSLKNMAADLNRWLLWSRKASLQVTAEDEFYDALDEIEPVSTPIERRVEGMELNVDTASRDGDSTASIDTSTAATTATIEQDLRGYPLRHRSTLPADSSSMPAISLWGILKNAIRQDLTRMPIPINFSEPLSMLQRMCEDMEYWPLLKQAAEEADPSRQLCLVAAFALSNYSSTDGRVTKPFNPLLGETYEFVCREGGFRYVAEQVSHHPPVGAAHCEAREFEYWTEVRVASKFRGRYLELQPEGQNHLLLRGANGPDRRYRWNRVKTAVNNIIVGKLYLEHFGEMLVATEDGSLSAAVNFLSSGWRQRPDAFARIEGHVTDRHGKLLWRLTGAWNAELWAVNEADGARWLVWKRHEPVDAPYLYNFSPFTLALNEVTEDLRPLLCPTDSRLRPDQRAMEEGQFDAANGLKVQLEEKQRRARRLMESQPDFEYKPRWFHVCGDERGRTAWRYKGGYWEARGKWLEGDCPDIFL